MAARKVKLQFSDFNCLSSFSVTTENCYTAIYQTFKMFLVTTENFMPLCTLFPEIMELEM